MRFYIRSILILILVISTSGSLIPIQKALAWSGNYTVNDIGDRQYIASVIKKDSTDYYMIGVGCTEGLFQVKIISTRGPLDNSNVRVRFDNKKIQTWSVEDSPSSGGLYSLNFTESLTFYSKLKMARTMAIQFYTFSGANLTTKFNVSGASLLAKNLRKAGCQI